MYNHWHVANVDCFAGHYISDESCELRSFLLDSLPFDEIHTVINLAKTIKEVIDEWQLCNKILFCVSDNGSNIKIAIDKELR